MSSHLIRSLRLAVIFCLALFLSVASLQAARFQNQQVKPPNIVVFLVDDMGVMDTSVPFLTDSKGQPKRYPLNDYYITPSMERLAKQGIRFNHFYAMSVCSPTRISIMSGQNAARHHATNWINPQKNNAGPQGPPDWNWAGLKKDDVTLPRLLEKAGYRTIHVGKGHFGADGFPGAEPLNLGFDVNIAGSSFGAPGSYHGMKKFGLGTRRAHQAVPHLEKYHDTDIFLTEALTIEANASLAETVKADQPFFLYMAHYAVHAPFDSDPRFADHYKDSDKPKNAQAFATLIEGMDKSLGDIMNQLEALGVAENTLIFFVGPFFTTKWPVPRRSVVKKGPTMKGACACRSSLPGPSRIPRTPIRSCCRSPRTRCRHRSLLCMICSRRFSRLPMSNRLKVTSWMVNRSINCSQASQIKLTGIPF